MPNNECFLLMGGAGLTGKQIAREIAKKLQPRKIIIGSLRQAEVEAALDELRQMFAHKNIEWVGTWGNAFVRDALAHDDRRTMLNDPARRQQIYDDLYGPMDAAYETSHLVRTIREHRPDVVIDTINTATAISYQDAHTASILAWQTYKEQADNFDYDFELLILSQALPQLVRHVQLLYRALCEVNARLYLKVGTTGTGGMGLNIPYTHSEDKPSVKLMTKNAVAFAHTGLMFLMARTPGPIVKEIKPGAMIGYADVAQRTITEHGQTVYLYSNRQETLGDTLRLHENGNRYQRLGTLDLPVVDTGENGFYTKGEFEAITALRQMEFLTPEEIAREVVLEIRGSNTGYDVIAAIDSSVMNPTYRAGYLRQQVLNDMAHLEEETGTHSIALGMLGPPEISKLLWEAELLRLHYGTLHAVLNQTPEDIADCLYHSLLANEVMCQHITSIGLPILSPDGSRLIRGPRIRIPEIPGMDEVPLNTESIEAWAHKGWVDLRPQNFVTWQDRFDIMQHARQQLRGRGSAAVTREAYLHDRIVIGEIVGWIFNNEENGYRIK